MTVLGFTGKTERACERDVLPFPLPFSLAENRGGESVADADADAADGVWTRACDFKFFLEGSVSSSDSVSTTTGVFGAFDFFVVGLGFGFAGCCTFGFGFIGGFPFAVACPSAPGIPWLSFKLHFALPLPHL
jgi:hypothetical protein